MPRPAPPGPDAHPFDALVALMRILRGPEGCPWDRQQDLRSLEGYALEEVHELLEAIESGDADRHREELGDVLLQIVFQSQIRWEEGAFDAYDVCRAITDKMLRRHPHVFGDEEATTASGGRASWERAKAKERAAKGEAAASALDGVPRALPALLRAARLGEKAGALGFDWPEPAGVLEKVREELGELEEAMAGGDPEALRHELGDLLAAVVSLGRHLGVDAEGALQAANGRFTRRFSAMERAPGGLAGRSLDELEALWQAAKREEG